MKSDKMQIFHNVINTYFIYDPTFQKLGLDMYSNSYARTILFPLASESQDYGIIYVDGDNIRHFNNTYSEKQGDSAMKNSLSLILSQLPEQTSLCRIGGDEFIFYVPNSSEAELIPFIKDAKESLVYQQSMFPQFYIGMSMGIADSQDKTFFQALEDAEEKVRINKKMPLSHHLDYWKSLEQECTKLWSRYFNLRRIASMSEQYIGDTSPKTKSLFEKGLKEAKHGIQKDVQEKSENTNLSRIHSLPYQKIHDFLTKPELESKTDITEKDLKILLNILTRNNNTNLFNKIYFRTFLEHKLETNIAHGQEYGILFYHITGLKESNDLSRSF